MLFENVSLKTMYISEIMDKNILKFKYDVSIDKIIESLIDSNHEAILIFEDDFKELLDILSPLDILKISNQKLSIKEYIDENSKRIKLLKHNRRVEETVNIIINNNIQYIPIEGDEGEIIGIVSSNKLF